MARPALLLLFALSAGCGGALDAGDPTGTRSEAIINGQSCTPGEAPTAVAVISTATWQTETAQGATGNAYQETEVICTGTLIAPDTILSAAHCVDPNVIGSDIESETGTMITNLQLQFFISYQANLSALNNGQSMALPSDAVAVSNWVENPSFSPGTASSTGLQNFHDTSLLFLSQVQTVPPELLIQASEATQLGAQAPVEIAGWGQTEDSMSSPSGVEECAASFINQLGTTEMQIGAGPTTSYACHGDSGGPAYMDVTTPYTNKRRLVGITSHAYDSAYCDQGAVDTRVDAYLDWINTTMTDACNAQARIWCDQPGIILPSYFQSSTGTTSSGSGTTNGTGPGAPVLPPPKTGCGSASVGVWALAGLLARRRRARR